jgi:hypothetical protein
LCLDRSELQVSIVNIYSHCKKTYGDIEGSTQFESEVNYDHDLGLIGYKINYGKVWRAKLATGVEDDIRGYGVLQEVVSIVQCNESKKPRHAL